jgi:hypothetical protein
VVRENSSSFRKARNCGILNSTSKRDKHDSELVKHSLVFSWFLCSFVQ